MNHTNILVGKNVKSATIIHDYLQILLSEAYGLNIYNKFKLSGGSIDELTEKEIVSLSVNSNNFVIKFSGEMLLEVDLSSSAYSGPESFEIWTPSGETIVNN